ncbi:hypothetical protein ABZ646_00350 [Streptomyces sp. NPDC007162]|uniref:hypothetical protein n=1 Tax=Streptomyces sp. NPDC007162 TaxID=3156917 RepID=UPI0033FB7D2B
MTIVAAPLSSQSWKVPRHLLRELPLHTAKTIEIQVFVPMESIRSTPHYGGVGGLSPCWCTGYGHSAGGGRPRRLGRDLVDVVPGVSFEVIEAGRKLVTWLWWVRFVAVRRGAPEGQAHSPFT